MNRRPTLTLATALVTAGTPAAVPAQAAARPSPTASRPGRPGWADTSWWPPGGRAGTRTSTGGTSRAATPTSSARPAARSTGQSRGPADLVYSRNVSRPEPGDGKRALAHPFRAGRGRGIRGGQGSADPPLPDLGGRA